MKKTWTFITLITLLAVFFGSAQVMASPADGPSLLSKKTPDHTPGAQATLHATEGNPHGNDNGNPHGKPANYKGTISAVDASSLTLTLDDGSTVTFILTADTRIKVPTLGQTATITDLKIGLKANVHAVQDDSGTLTAKSVLIVPGKPVLMHRVGVVSDYQAGVSITIQATDGNSYTYLITEQTKLLPAERAGQLAIGVRVTVIVPRDVTGGEPTASGIVIHPAQ